MKEDFKSILDRLFILVKIQDDNENTARLQSALYSALRQQSIEYIISDSDTDSEFTKLLNLMKIANRAVEHNIDKYTSTEAGTPVDVCLSPKLDPLSRVGVAQSEQKDSSPP